MDENAATASLVRRCLAGDAGAWEALVRQHNRRIYNICYRFTGSQNNAEDLTQEVFIKVYRTLSTFDGEKGSFHTWVTTVTRNLLVDHFRKTKQERVTDSIDASIRPEAQELSLGDRLQDGKLSPDDQVAAKEMQGMIQRALQKISPDLREAVILRDLQDMDYKEIATVLRVPEGTVKSRINRGRAELGKHLSRITRQVS